MGDLQALPSLFECSEHLTENRGVPGSSPGLAISGTEPRINAGFSGRRCVGAGRSEHMSADRVPQESDLRSWPGLLALELATPCRSCPNACPIAPAGAARPW